MLLTGTVLVGRPAMAQTLDTAGATSCEVRGYAIDTDPRGTNVRAAPRPDAPIIGHLAPPSKVDPNTETGIEFDIVGSKDGWLLIRNGSDGGLTFDAAHKADGRGWVSAKLVGTQLRLPAFRSAPRRDAPEIAHFHGDTWGPDSAVVAAIHGCRGKYIEVTAGPPDGKALRGWSYLPCSLQLTTCDGGVTE
ncbi:MAG TPA: SH3 domain-containing protein [Reyranella sp.]|nr:SH3 domain-containing protein [Reyranella sp.]